MSSDRVITCIILLFALLSLSSASSRLLPGKEEPMVTVPIHGNMSQGYYFVDMYFGMPPQKKSMLIDTGSLDIVIPCKACGSNCGTHHLHEFYDPKKSETDREMVCGESYGSYWCSDDCKDQCGFEVSYFDESGYKGNYRQDLISFENWTPTDDQKMKRPQRILEKGEEWASLPATAAFVPYGCAVKESGSVLEQKADGILGLGWGTDDRNHPFGIRNGLKYSVAEDAFSLCMGPQGGYMTIGGYNATYHEKSEKPEYFSIEIQERLYGFYWNTLHFAGGFLGFNSFELNAGRGAFMDSGTTMFTTTPKIYERMLIHVDSFCQFSKENCGGYKKEEGKCWYYDKKKYPNIKDFFETFASFQFGFGKDHEGVVNYEWKAEDYLIKKNGKDDLYCLGIEKHDKSGEESVTIFGQTFMRNHDFFFGQHRMGFVRAECSAGYSLSIESPVLIIGKSYLLYQVGILAVLLLVVWLLISRRKKMTGVKIGGVELQDEQRKKQENTYAELAEEGESSPDLVAI